MNLLDSSGKPIPNEEQKKQAEEIQEVMTTLQPLLQGKSIDVGVSVALNLLLAMFQHVPIQAEEQFVNSVLTSLGNIFAQQSQIKKQIATQLQQQQNALNGAIREAVNDSVIKH